MSDLVEESWVQVGQVWEDRDGRPPGRRIRIVWVDPPGIEDRKVIAENIKTGRRNRISLRRLRPRFYQRIS